MEWIKIKKWVPFVLLLLIMATSLVYLLLAEQDSAYFPQTDDPATIYHEACKHCHGESGEGTGLFYPDLSEENLSKDKIRKVIINGEMFMPAFKSIKGDTLEHLVEYVFDKKYIN